MGDGPKKHYDADAVRDFARNAWDAVLMKHARVNGSLLQNKHGPCPGCGGRDRFRFDDRDGSGSFICSQGGGGILSGDGIELYAHIQGIDWVDAVNELGEKLIPDQGRQASSNPRPKPKPQAQAPERKPQGILSFDLDKLRQFCRMDLGTDEAWFYDRNPIDLEGIQTPEDFLAQVYRPDERVLVFTNFFSQAQYLFEPGRGAFILGQAQGIQAKRVDRLPVDNMEGVWFLNQPVSGQWKPNPRGKRDDQGGLPWSRRSKESVTDWRFLVLESDDAPFDLWLNFLAIVPVPIVAIYTSGVRSIHALVKLDVHSKPDFDLVRRSILPLFSRLGADPGALTAIRLTRLPGCRRRIVSCSNCGKTTTAKPKAFQCKKCETWVRPEDSSWAKQKLIYLNPSPDPSGLPIYQGGNQIVKP
jgi:hypothetical protein